MQIKRYGLVQCSVFNVHYLVVCVHVSTVLMFSVQRLISVCNPIKKIRFLSAESHATLVTGHTTGESSAL